MKTSKQSKWIVFFRA